MVYLVLLLPPYSLILFSPLWHIVSVARTSSAILVSLKLSSLFWNLCTLCYLFCIWCINGIVHHLVAGFYWHLVICLCNCSSGLAVLCRGGGETGKNRVRSNVGDGNEYGDDGVDVGTRVIVFVTLDCLYSLLSRRRFVIYIAY